jgi:2-desacetyl-2-hydroxyethyl bacteriochlorophyllide A dehydrogenase
MRALVLTRPNDFAVRDVPEPSPGSGEVLVSVRACGICGTDLHIVAGEYPPTPFPYTPGHESAGEVVGLGAGVRSLSLGDRVGIDASLWCGVCEYCRGGARNVCPDRGGIGGTVDGGFAQLVVAPAENCFRIPAHVPYREAAVAEPLSCVLHGTGLLRPAFRPSVLVLGAGTMGLLALQVMRAAGAARVDVVNRGTARRALAAELGADATFAPGEQVGRYDVVVEATGVPALVTAGLAALAPRGQLLLLGVSAPHDEVAVSPFRLYEDELTVLGSMGAKDTYQQAIDAIASGVVRVAPLLGGAFGLDEFDDALRAVAAGGAKVHVLPNG